MSDEKEDDPLELYWDDVRVSRHRVPVVPDTTAENLRAQVQPGDLVIGTSRERVLAIIKADGQVEFGPDYKPDEAAMVFWEAMGRQRYAYEERILLIRHMEALLTRLGAQDLLVEQLRLASANGDIQAGQRAGGAMVQLERLVHQVIELGRGLARRPEIPVPDIPERVPDRIRENPQSAYAGRAGIGPDDEPIELPDDEPN